MEVLNGIAKKIHITQQKEGSTTTCEINGKPVELHVFSKAVINEGDEIAVAGKFSRGVFKARAYKNTTNGASGKRWVFILLGLGLMLSPILVELPMLFIGWRNMTAYNLVKNS
ncbi:MAG: hypothetical protein HOM11_13185 [Methylococcales bacterium]|jgi:hypothetical protein|nr:hypothetical protein [Methylococcales bacterium]